MATAPLLPNALTAEQEEWLAERRAAFARASAALPEIMDELRASGQLKPLPRGDLKAPLFKRGPLDADYWDNGQTIEDGE